MANEPAEDRSVRGNTIKPAIVEPEQEIEIGFLPFKVKEVKETGLNGSTQINTGVSTTDVVSYFVRANGFGRAVSSNGPDTRLPDAVAFYHYTQDRGGSFAVNVDNGTDNTLDITIVVLYLP
jgi:hypothetical protein